MKILTQKQEDTIENPQNNHIIVDQGHSWDFHVVVFHPWEFIFFVKYMFLAKAKRKGMDKKENMTIWAKKVGHNRGPQNNHTIGDQDGSWTTPLKNCLGAMF